MADTMIYTVDLGDGQVMDIEGPPDATPEQLQKIAAGGVSPVAPVDAEDPGAGGMITKPDGTQRLRVNITGGVPEEIPPETTALGALGRGALDTATLGLADEAGAGIEAAYASLINGEDFSDRYAEAVGRNRGLAEADNEQHQAFRIAGQLLGGLAIPVGLEGVAFRAGRDALRAGLTIGEARAIGARAVTQRMAATGAASGAAYGAGSGETASERLLGAGTGAALGAASGAALGVAGQMVAPRAVARASARRAAPLTEGQRLVAAADRIGVDALPADVGGATVRRLTGGATQAPLSASPIVAASQRVLQQGQAARDAAAAGSGAAVGPEAAGVAAREGAQAYVQSSRRAGGGMYRRAEALAGDVTIDPAEARSVLDQQIARLQAVPGGGAGLAEAEALRESLNGRFTVQGIRDMRTEMFVAPELRGTQASTRLRQVVDAAARDVENGLRGQGRGAAADAFRQADDFWRERLDTIDNFVEPIIGDASKGGEAITKSLEAAAKGDVNKLHRFMSTLPPDQHGVVTASFISRLGRASKGNQNAEGDAFSLATFLSNWNELSPRARNVLFSPEQRAALTDLATVAGGARNAARYANHSNTAGAVTVQALLTGLSGVVGLKTLGASVAGQLAMGHLLASPRFARWLARAPQSRLSGPAYLDRLTRIARAEPAIANDVLSLQRSLADTFSNTATRAAADDRRGSE